MQPLIVNRKTCHATTNGGKFTSTHLYDDIKTFDKYHKYNMTANKLNIRAEEFSKTANTLICLLWHLPTVMKI